MNVIKNFISNVFSNKIDAKFPDFAQDYLKLFDGSLELNEQLKLVTFVVLDTETTGLNPKEDKIISIGAVKMQNNAIDINESLSIYLKNYDIVNRDAISIHGSLPHQADGIDELEMARKILLYVGNQIIVGHHINFDVMMINKMLQELHLPRLKNLTIDTAQLIERIENPLNAYNLVDSKEFSLDELSQKFDIITKQRHTAAGDAYITALVFIRLLELLKKREVRTLKGLLRR